MASRESLSRSLHTVTELQSIVRTMKALAAGSIRQYSQAEKALDEYAATVEGALQVVLRQPGRAPEAARPGGSRGVVVVGSDQGMCGAFNQRVVAFACEPRGEARWLAVGGRVVGPLEGEGYHPDSVLRLPVSAAGLAVCAQDVVLALEQWRQTGVDGVVEIVFQRIRGAQRELCRVQLLPAPDAWLSELAKRHWSARCRPALLEGAEPTFAALMRQHLFVSVYRALAASLAAESAARLEAMQAAETHINSRFDELNGEFHQLVQAAVTQELLEVVAGFQAVGADATSN